MAVYTKILKKNLEELISSYNIGNLTSFKGIEEGVENSNYRIKTSKGKYILTIFEKRVIKSELPFFIGLMNHLSKKRFKCPKPIKDRHGNYIRELKNKPCLIVSFIEGGWVKNINNNHCQQLGHYLAKLHIATKDFNLNRENNMGKNNWRRLYNNFKDKNKTKFNNIYKIIEKEIDTLNKRWPKQLSSGVIHADLFQDNFFFINDKFSGVIDFYFACNDFYVFELAICLNAWCFERDQSFNITKARSILKSYQKINPLNEEEKKYFPILSRGAALRFLLTRLNDLIYHNQKTLVKPKDPMEYLKILNFHQSITSINEYGIEN